jgi:hypothetical protein
MNHKIQKTKIKTKINATINDCIFFIYIIIKTLSRFGLPCYPQSIVFHAFQIESPVSHATSF